MASTFKPSDAFDFAKIMIKRYSLENVKLAILQNALSQLWMWAPWGFTVNFLPIVTIIPNQEDQAISPFPGDFFDLDTVYLHDTVSIDMPKPSLRVVPFLPSTVGAPFTGQPKLVTRYVSGGNHYYRLRPFLSSSTTNTYKLIGTYKRTVPLITTLNVGTAGVHNIPDEWWWVYQEIVLYWAYLYSDDPRSEKKLMYVNKELLPFMASKEALPLAELMSAPETPRLS